MLFACLKQHTKETVRWQALNEWKQAWDKCRRDIDKLRESARKILVNRTKGNPDLLERVVADSDKKNALDKLIAGALEAVWQHILDEKSDRADDLVRIGSYGRGIYTVTMGRGETQVQLSLEKKVLVEEIASVVSSAVDKLVADIAALLAASEVKIMRGRIAELEEKLYPVMLRKQVLYTRCDLCPVQ